MTEFFAAPSIKMRTGELEPHHRAESLAALTRLAVESFAVLPISGAEFRTAARFADQYVPGLRADEAPHLAVAADYGATIATLNRWLADASSTLGVGARIL